jgi:hypothetical protein
LAISFVFKFEEWVPGYRETAAVQVPRKEHLAISHRQLALFKFEECSPRLPRNGNGAARNVNGFWVMVCQDVLISEALLTKNPVDCRIFFADNPRRKTESGIGGKNP